MKAWFDLSEFSEFSSQPGTSQFSQERNAPRMGAPGNVQKWGRTIEIDDQNTPEIQRSAKSSDYPSTCMSIPVQRTTSSENRMEGVWKRDIWVGLPTGWCYWTVIGRSSLQLNRVVGTFKYFVVHCPTNLSDTFLRSLTNMHANVAPMATKESIGPPHIPVSLLWQYTKDTIALFDSEIDHLNGCEHCAELLGLCCACTSLEHVERIIGFESGGRKGSAA
jgi:hypothetical protein